VAVLEVARDAHGPPGREDLDPINRPRLGTSNGRQTGDKKQTVHFHNEASPFFGHCTARQGEKSNDLPLAEDNGCGKFPWQVWFLSPAGRLLLATRRKPVVNRNMFMEPWKGDCLPPSGYYRSIAPPGLLVERCISHGLAPRGYSQTSLRD